MNANEPDVVRKHFGVGKRGSFLAPGDLWPTPPPSAPQQLRDLRRLSNSGNEINATDFMAVLLND